MKGIAVHTRFQNFLYSNKSNEARTLGSLANTYRNDEQYEKAIELYQQSLSIKREISDRQGMPMTLKNLAKLYQMLGKLDLARDYCQQAIDLAIELGIPLAAECEKLLLKIDRANDQVGDESGIQGED